MLAAAVALLGAMLALRRPLAAHDDRQRGAQRAARLAGAGGVATRRRRRVAAGRRRASRASQQASPTATAPFAGVDHARRRRDHERRARGAILAVPPGYLRHIHTFRFLQRLAAAGRDRARPAARGDAAGADRRHGHADAARAAPRRSRFPVTGVALVTAPDVLFQPLNPLLGPAPAQPPANIAIMPLDTFAATLAPALPAIAAGASGALGGARRAERRRSGRCRRRSTRQRLGGSPGQALHAAPGRSATASSARCPGRSQFVDNLSDS